MTIETVIYQSDNPVYPGRKFAAFIVKWVDEVVDHKKTGQKIKNQLPVIFYGTTAEQAHERAMTFWDEETAKAKAKTERGKALAKRKAD